MLFSYIKIALRRLAANRLHAAINTLGLAMGMISCLVIYIFVNYQLNFDHFHTDAKRTYRVVEHSKKANGVQHWGTTAYPLAEAIRQDFPEVTVTQAVGPLHQVVSAARGPGSVIRFEENNFLFVDSNYLKMFDFKGEFGDALWLSGNAQTAFSAPNAVILTQKLADRYFPENRGDYKNLVGKSLMLNNKETLVVTGVVKNPPHNTNLMFDILVNYAFFKKNDPYRAQNWSGNYQGSTYLTLPLQTDKSAFEAKLATLKKKYMHIEDDKRISYLLQPLRDIHTNTLYEDVSGSYPVSRQTLWGLSSLAVFLIMIASFNFINLTTAQASQRSKEVGVRKAVGSTQSQLFTQFIGETFIITLVAGGISFLVLPQILHWLNRSLTLLSLDLHIQPVIWLLGLLLIVLLAVLAGFYPALILSRFKPIKALKNKAEANGQRFSLRQGLIVVQFGITYFLMIGMMVASRQMQFFNSKSLGFEKNAVLTVKAPEGAPWDKLQVYRQQLLENPAVEDVSLSSGAPATTNYYGTNFRLKSEEQTMDRQAEMKIVDLPYQSLFSLKMISGNWFSTSNLQPKNTRFNGFVINEKMVKALGLTPQQAIGQVLTISEGEAPVIGVIKDFHNMSLQEAITPVVMMCGGPGSYEQIQIKVRAGANERLDISGTIGRIEQNWKQVFPDDIFQYSFLNDALAKSYLVEQFVYDAFRIFAAISIVIACLGLFGLITFAAAQRTKEIGVRKVLGASVGSIVSLLSKDFLQLILLAVLLSSPFSWYMMQRWLGNFEYRIGIEWWIFVIAALASVGLALLTISYQSVKSALMNPVKSLKSE